MNKLALHINHLTVGYPHCTKPILWDLTAKIPAGVLCAVVGPNGAGKTTLLKTILGFITPIAGSILINGKNYKTERKNIAYTPQRTSIDWDFPTTVLDVVLMGTYGKIGWFFRPRKKEYMQAYEALKKVNLLSFANSPIGQLSGGQQQRVFLARAIVQNAPLYLLDEPLNNIDATTEKTIIEQLKQLKNENKTIIVVHHDLNTLQDYFDWVLFLNIKKIACGPVNQVFEKNIISSTYTLKNDYF